MSDDAAIMRFLNHVHRAEGLGRMTPDDMYCLKVNARLALLAAWGNPP